MGVSSCNCYKELEVFKSTPIWCSRCLLSCITVVVFKIDLNWPEHADCLGSLLLGCCLARSRWTWISHQPAKSYHSFLGLLINSRSLCDWLLCFVSQESAPLSYPFLFGLAICMLGHRKILMFMLQRTCRCLTAANRFSIFAADWRYQSYIYIYIALASS